MAQDSVTILQGESRLITMYLSAGAGTVSATNPTFTLWDPTKTIVTGYDHVPATADPAAAIVKVQYLLDTTGLAAGSYYALLKASATTSADGITQNREYDYAVYIQRVPDL